MADATPEELAKLEQLVTDWVVEWLTSTRPPKYTIHGSSIARHEVRMRLNKGCRALGFYPETVYSYLVKPVLQKIVCTETGYEGNGEYDYYYQRSFGLFTVPQ